MLKGTLLMAGSIQQHGIYKGMDRRRVVKRTILPAMEHGSGHFCTWWSWLDMVATTSCPSSGVCTFMTFNRTLEWSKRSSRCFKTHWYPTVQSAKYIWSLCVCGCVQPYTSKSFRVISISLEKCQWKTTIRRFDYASYFHASHN